ncbi:putative RNA polymerase sigma factor [Flavobacteriaceae bacterium UJ101]|nr:putative RNA polymerase sigma factor [Flavobacteriaceae bacterium UJ101]
MLLLRLNKEQKLLRKCASGDRKAQLELYKKYAQGMFKVSFSIVRNSALAEDVVQEAFISIFKNLNSFKGEVTFGAWMKRIVINKSISALKKEKRFDFETELEEFVEETNWEESKIDLIRLKQCMQQLSDKDHTIISLYYLEGYDHAEIAEILNISYDNSRTILSRAKVKLKNLIENERSIKKDIEST